MLRYAEPKDFSYTPLTNRRWVIDGGRPMNPQGFSFRIGFAGGTKNFWWTSNEFAAYTYFKRFGNGSKEVEEDFKARLSKEQELYKLSSATHSSIDLIGPETFSYRDYQKAGIEYCLKTKNTLIADEMRLGKTIVALGVINNIPDINRTLVICPKTAKPGWYEEAKRWLVRPVRFNLLNTKSIFNDETFLIVNYDILHMLPWLQKIKFDLIISDEVHLTKNTETRRAKFFHELYGKKLIDLTGTPLSNKPPDLLNIITRLDPFWSDFSIKKDQFVHKYGINLSLNEVQEILRSTIMLRRLQSQVFDTEPVEKRIVCLPVSEDTRPLVERELTELADYAKVRRLLGLKKVPLIIKHIQTYTTNGEKIVVFGQHQEVIERIAASFGVKAEILYGSSSDKQRQHAKKRFSDDPTCQILLGSIGAASMAIDLSVSNHIVFAECDWRSDLMAQAEERCSNKNQKNQVIIEYLVLDKSLDWRILNNLEGKYTRNDSALDLIYE